MSDEPAKAAREKAKEDAKAQKKAEKERFKRLRPSGVIIEKHVYETTIVLLVSVSVLAVLFVIDWDPFRLLATAAAIFLASALVGAFGGFLFGLPRDVPLSAAERPLLHFAFNSNLLKVSDWLTTIIVGLTLVNLGSIVPALAQLGEAMEEPLGGYDQSEAFGLALVISGVAGAAVLTYIWTTVRLREHLERSEIELKVYLVDAEALDVVVDFLEGRGTVGVMQSTVKGMTTSGIQQLQDRLPDFDKPEEAKARRDRVDQAIAERLV